MARPSSSVAKEPHEMSLKALHTYYLKHYRFNDIPPAYNLELKLRYKNYDMAKMRFCGAPQPRNPMPRQFAHMSKTDLLDYYNRQPEISDELNVAMSHTFSNYNIVTRSVLGAQIMARRVSIPRVQYNMATKNDAFIKQLFFAQRAKGKIDDELHEEMMRRFPKSYDANKRDMIKTFVVAGAKVVQEMNAGRSVSDVQKQTVKPGHIGVASMFDGSQSNPSEMDHYMDLVRNLKDNFGDRLSKNSADIDDIDDDFEDVDVFAAEHDRSLERYLAPSFDVNDKEEVAPRVMPPKIVALPQAKDGAPLIVEKYETKNGANGIYNRVTVNGVTVLDKHVDTEIKTFMDGRILGVRGIATDETAYPQKATWHLYPMVQGFTLFSAMEKYGEHYVYVKQVVELPNGELRLTLSNNSQIMFGPQKFERLGKGVRFQIANQKTR